MTAAPPPIHRQDLDRSVTWLRLGVSIILASWLLTGTPEHAHAQNASTPSAIDTFSLRAYGATHRGAKFTPRADLAPQGTWDVNIAYQFEGAPIRAIVPTGDIRGRNQFETLPWLQRRHALSLTTVVALTDRIEWVMDLPFLINQQGKDGRIIPAAAGGASAIGDLHMLARVAILPMQELLSWTIQAGIYAPTGQPSLLFGEQRTRLEVGTTLSAKLPKGFTTSFHLQHQSGRMDTLGNQIFGDTISAFASVDQQIGPYTWYAELLNQNVVSASPAGQRPKRSSLEIVGGGRITWKNVYTDLVVGFSPLDQHTAPRFRTLVSIGTTGLFQRQSSADSQCEMSCLATREIQQQLQRIETISRQSQHRPTDATCVRAPEGFDGPVTDTQCIDFIQWNRDNEHNFHAHRRMHLYFEINKGTLAIENENTLRNIAQFLHQTDVAISIVGHADDTGNLDSNLTLSKQRAKYVYDALSNAGIDQRRMSVEARGQSDPAAPTTDFGRSINRRVTITLQE